MKSEIGGREDSQGEVKPGLKPPETPRRPRGDLGRPSGDPRETPTQETPRRHPRRHPPKVMTDFGQTDFGQPFWLTEFGQTDFDLLCVVCVCVCLCECVLCGWVQVSRFQVGV